MKSHLKGWATSFYAVAAGSVFTFASVANEEDAQKVIFQFVGKYCLECHDDSVQKAEREFESFDLPLESIHDLISAKEIIDQVTLREMPPKEADQPTDEERIAVVRALRDSLALAQGKIESSDSLTVMRRLSNREYEETLRVLFDRRIDTLGLTKDFPKEKTSRHIDTIGKSLVTSGFLLDQYFQAALYLHETQTDLPLALSYIQKATQGDDTRFFMVYREALILKDLDRKEEAMEAAMRTKKLAQKAGNDDIVRLSQRMLEQLSD